MSGPEWCPNCHQPTLQVDTQSGLMLVCPGECGWEGHELEAEL